MLNTRESSSTASIIKKLKGREHFEPNIFSLKVTTGLKGTVITSVNIKNGTNL